jgi:hypothetical protein
LTEVIRPLYYLDSKAALLPSEDWQKVGADAGQPDRMGGTT